PTTVPRETSNFLCPASPSLADEVQQCWASNNQCRQKFRFLPTQTNQKPASYNNSFQVRHGCIAGFCNQTSRPTLINPCLDLAAEQLSRTMLSNFLLVPGFLRLAGFPICMG